jgi:hypothetical protein
MRTPLEVGCVSLHPKKYRGQKSNRSRVIGKRSCRPPIPSLSKSRSASFGTAIIAGAVTFARDVKTTRSSVRRVAALRQQPPLAWSVPLISVRTIGGSRYSSIGNLDMRAGRVEVSAPLQTRAGVAIEFVVIGDLIGPGIVGETPHPQPSWVDAAALQFGVNRVTDEFGRHHCKCCPEDDHSPRRRAPNSELTYTSSFQYSLTSYLRTSSTQVVSSPCRGISRS